MNNNKLRDKIFSPFRRVFIIICLLVSGCYEDNLIVNSEIIPGKFIVDDFSMSAGVKINPQKDSLGSFISHSLTYHFENQPGSIQSFWLGAAGYSGLDILADPAFPNPINQPSTVKNTFWLLKNDFSNLDSITLKCSLNGAFWNTGSTGARFLGEFDWSTEIKVVVER